jgi:hypothetical protein
MEIASNSGVVIGTIATGGKVNLAFLNNCYKLPGLITFPIQCFLTSRSMSPVGK